MEKQINKRNDEIDNLKVELAARENEYNNDIQSVKEELLTLQ